MLFQVLPLASFIVEFVYYPHIGAHMTKVVSPNRWEAYIENLKERICDSVKRKITDQKNTVYETKNRTDEGKIPLHEKAINKVPKETVLG